MDKTSQPLQQEEKVVGLTGMLRVRGSAAAACAAAIIGIAAAPTVGLSAAQELPLGEDNTIIFELPAKEHHFVTNVELRRLGSEVPIQTGEDLTEGEALTYYVEWAPNAQVLAGDYFTFKVPTNLGLRYPHTAVIGSPTYPHPQIAELVVEEGGIATVTFNENAEGLLLENVEPLKITSAHTERMGSELRTVYFDLNGQMLDMKLPALDPKWSAKDSAGAEIYGANNWDQLMVITPVGSYSAEQRGELTWHVALPAPDIAHRNVAITLNATGDWNFNQDPFSGADPGTWRVAFNDGKTLKLENDLIQAGEAVDLPLVFGTATNPGDQRLTVDFYSDRYTGVGESTALTQKVFNIALPDAPVFTPEEAPTVEATPVGETPAPAPEPTTAPVTASEVLATPSASASASSTVEPRPEEESARSTSEPSSTTAAQASSEPSSTESTEASESGSANPQDPLDGAGQDGEAPPADQPTIDERRVAQRSVRVEEPPTFVENMSPGSVALNAVAAVAVLGGAALLIRLR